MGVSTTLGMEQHYELCYLFSVCCDGSTNNAAVSSVDTQIQPLIDTAKPAIN